MIDRHSLWPQHQADMYRANRSPKTIRARYYVLDQLARATDLADITEGDVRIFTGSPHLDAASRRAYSSHIRSFYAWAVRRRLLDHNPAADLEPIKVHAGIPHPIERDMLAVAIAEAKPNVRAWMLLGCYAGLRRFEIAQLRGEDRRGGVLHVVGKGRRPRTVPEHPVLAAELDTWPRTGYLWPGRYGGHISAERVGHAVNQHLHRLGIDSTCHALRHRFGTDIYAGSGIRQTQELLGHASPATTAIYTKVDAAELVAAVAGLDFS